VIESAVVAWPSKTFGEEIAAFVVARPDAADTKDPEALLKWCGENLARYKLPRKVFFVDDLPKSGVGKVLKADLTDRLTPIDD
jgi:acyl-CoA synthetase (AMP-forming)/AMP-acid ligase II